MFHRKYNSVVNIENNYSETEEFKKNPKNVVNSNAPHFPSHLTK